MENNDSLILEIIQSHSLLLTAMSEGLGHAMKLSLDSVPKCTDPECEKPSTWILVDKHKPHCDRHRAISICKNESVEDDWEETDNCESVRKIQEFIEIKEKFESMYTIH